MERPHLRRVQYRWSTANNVPWQRLPTSRWGAEEQKPRIATGIDNIYIFQRFVNETTMTEFGEAVWNGVHHTKAVALQCRD